jgi:transposase
MARMSKRPSAALATQPPASDTVLLMDRHQAMAQEMFDDLVLSPTQRDGLAQRWGQALGELEARLQAEIEARLQVEIEARLQTEIESRLKAEIESRLKAEFEARVQALYEQIRLARQRMFGRSSEAHVGQGGLFNEAETVVDDTTTADEAAPEACTPDLVVALASEGKSSPQSTPKARGKRAPLPPELPRIEVIHDLPEAQRRCTCGAVMVQIGEEISEQLDIVPMQIRVLRHCRKRYACHCGECAPQVAPAVAQVIPKSLASADLLAMLLTTKYVDGLPLARFEYVLGRAGVCVPRQTLARWVIACARALQPLVNLLRDSLLGHDLIHMDETPVQVLKEAHRAASTQSYMWVQRGGPPGQPVILFDYDPRRAGSVPVRLLEGWQGYLMSDGYAGYGAIGAQPGVIPLACWTHARRYFVDAAKVQGNAPRGTQGRAQQAIACIAQLYAIEKQYRQASVAERAAARQTHSRVVLEQLRTWLDQALPTTPPQSALGKALSYLHEYWPRLIRYIERGDLPIDNNPAENAIRPFVVGRKAWLFSDTPAGAHASAAIYSLIETAKANGQEPYTWLRNTLQHLPNATTLEHYEALIPWHFKPEHLTTP